MKPEGFLFEDLGPIRKMGKGTEQAVEMAELVRKRAGTGCPFSLAAKA